ncbi:hypothetical protein BHM03_00057957 [Ensete ventricosum]|nr:hypothetical protein BHM03_00057957 [Ensete ventricosum]
MRHCSITGVCLHHADEFEFLSFHERRHPADGFHIQKPRSRVNKFNWPSRLKSIGVLSVAVQHPFPTWHFQGLKRQWHLYLSAKCFSQTLRLRSFTHPSNHRFGTVADNHTTMEDEEITQEDAWAVISAYFEEKGLVRQQLDSFDEFISTTMQGIVDESADIEILPERQHHPGRRPDSDEVPLSFPR